MRSKTVGATYLLIGAIFAAFVAVLGAVVVWTTPALVVQRTALIQPVVALVGLTAIVFVLMIVYRNFALIRGAASLRYFQTATLDQPAEKVERPARAYANLLEPAVRTPSSISVSITCHCASPHSWPARLRWR